MAKQQDDVRVAAATGSAHGGGEQDTFAQRIHDAMHQATVDCLNEGIIEPEEILKRKFAARDAILAE